MNPYIQYMYSYPHKTAYGALSGVNLKDYAQRLSGSGHGLYLHIPFCQTKCGYCNLFSVTGVGSRDIDQYFDAIERQLQQYQPILETVGTYFSEFTIGGGTPLYLSEKQLERVFSITDFYLRFENGRQLVIETAPNQTNKEKLNLLKNQKTTRISMGIQSFSDEVLKILKRNHSGKKAREALDLLLSFEFPCVNIDFIYGIPGQTIDSLLTSLKEAISFGIDEIFLYPLYVKHGAILEQDIQKGIVLKPDYTFVQYQEASQYLKAEGFRQDSMRRFVRDREKTGKGVLSHFLNDMDSLEASNDKYRKFSDCGFSTSLAIGCGGRSYLGNLHFCTPYAITRQDCLSELKAYEDTKDFVEICHGIILSQEEEKRRYLIRHLLILPGVCIEKYQNLFGTNLLEDFPLLLTWLEEEYLTYTKDKKAELIYLTLTPKGLGLSDYLGPQLISENIQKKMEEWENVHK